MRQALLCCALLLCAVAGNAYTRQDTLRGSNGRGRDWWDVVKYDLSVKLDTSTKSIKGHVDIRFKTTGKAIDSMQIDLQEPLTIDKVLLVIHNEDAAGVGPPMRTIKKEGNVWWVIHPFRKEEKEPHTSFTLSIDYSGKPRSAVNPPWDGGFIWTKDSIGNRWISVACQGLGASSWWPCKDYQGDEPDDGMNFKLIDTTEQSIISNGKWPKELSDWHKTIPDSVVVYGSKSQYLNPINTYNTTFYIGDYAHWDDTLHGEKGVLDLDFYPLRYNEAKARKQWTQAKEMLRCFEWWMGPYPFYEDGYKLVEAPFLGMEHQSAIAYGNQYQNGYYRKSGHIDRSGTGVGFSFDFIIVHESGHEWFGNNITAQDPADNWLHEGFTTYTEALFAEWIKGKDSAYAYTMGQWKNIKNDRPVIGDYGVNNEGSSDKYDKGSAVVHMIRMMINDDKRFRELLRGLNKDFYHKIVTSKEVEEYISRFVGMDLKVFFDVYLRSTAKPVFKWSRKEGRLSYRWEGVPDGFFAPVVVNVSTKSTVRTTSASSSYWDVTPADVRRLEPMACGWYDVVKE
jgi:aminopeptidase N